MINLSFKILFTIEILHKYYADEVCDDFIITPSALTAATLSRYNMVCKQYNNRLNIGLRTDVSLLPVTDNLQLVFFLKCKNPLFNNFTNCPHVGIDCPVVGTDYVAGSMKCPSCNNSYPYVNVTNSDGKVTCPKNGNSCPMTSMKRKLFYFTNDNGAAVTGGNKTLTALIPAYSAGAPYKSGDLVTFSANGVSAVYESVNAILLAPAAPVSLDTTEWMVVDANSYVAAGDVKFLHYDQNFWKTDSATDSPNADANDMANNLQLADSLEILSDNNIFGVINILQISKLNQTLNLLTSDSAKAPDGTIVSPPLYSILFLNRATIWKYILLPDATVTKTISQSSTTTPAITFSNSQKSSRPIRFTKSKPLDASNDFQLAISQPAAATPQPPGTTPTPAQTILNLPLASPEMIVMPDTTGTPFISEIYLNY